MRSVRRASPDVRLEMTPLIDVVFLLLTFFVFSLVLMVRADVMDVKLPELSAGRSAERTPAITIVIDEGGTLFVEGEEAQLREIGDRVRALRAERGGSAPVLLAVDEHGRAGDLIQLADTLNAEGIGEFSVIGRPAKGTSPSAGDPAPAPRETDPRPAGRGFVPTGPAETEPG